MRKASAKKRPLEADPKFNDTLVTRFVNNLMWEGRKSTAFVIFYDAIALVEKNTKEENGLEIWKKALANISPSVEVKSRRIGGSTFQIPTEVRPDRKISVGIKWLIRYARDRKGKTMAEKLAAEIVAASKGEGAAVKKRDDVHRMADANKAFAHFRA
jgi:small subunit ribosomal protein S7